MYLKFVVGLVTLSVSRRYHRFLYWGPLPPVYLWVFNLFSIKSDSCSSPRCISLLFYLSLLPWWCVCWRGGSGWLDPESHTHCDLGLGTAALTRTSSWSAGPCLYKASSPAQELLSHPSVSLPQLWSISTCALRLHFDVPPPTNWDFFPYRDIGRCL